MIKRQKLHFCGLMILIAASCSLAKAEESNTEQNATVQKGAEEAVPAPSTDPLIAAKPAVESQPSKSEPESPRATNEEGNPESAITEAAPSAGSEEPITEAPKKTVVTTPLKQAAASTEVPASETLAATSARESDPSADTAPAKKSKTAETAEKLRNKEVIDLRSEAAELVREKQYAMAEPLLEKALSLSEREFGQADPETVGVMGELAAVYEADGKQFDALSLYERSAAISGKSRRIPAPNLTAPVFTPPPPEPVTMVSRAKKMGGMMRNLMQNMTKSVVDVMLPGSQ